MFGCKNILSQTSVMRRILFNNGIVSSFLPKYYNYCSLAVHLRSNYVFHTPKSRPFISPISLLHRKWCSKGLIQNDDSNLNVVHGKDIKKITDIFPVPRVTLHNFTAKTPNKVFDVHFKQNTVAPRGRKKPQQNDWTCSYVFVWPEKIKFECTALSKSKAAEKAATQAIHWLYTIKRINSKGDPIYDRNVLEEIKTTLNEPIRLTISDNVEQRIEKIWNEYQDGIKDIYEATFKDSKHIVINSPAVLTKDSTIDEDEFSENEDELDSQIDNSELKVRVHPVYGRNVNPPKMAALERRNRALNKTFQAYDEDLTPLPIDQYREQIISTLEQSRVVVIVGAAGCGKSTRAPAAILRHCGAKTTAIVSEPRRVAAIGLAERVASELGEKVGLSVGYQVRLHSKLPKPPCGSILYCTSGVLLRRLQTNPGLEGCSHVIIDEAHERDVNTDVTLLLLKRALDINEDLKIIIMSATLDTGVFTKYFGNCPIIDVPGRTFPVQISHLEDIQNKFNIKLTSTLENCQKQDGRPIVNCEEVAEVIKSVDKYEKEGAILVFLPGWAEIKQTKQILDEYYKNSGIHMILPVHSRLSTEDQSKMFSLPSPGIRKIVLSTNVAETSITIPDVVYVIDSGSHKENRIIERTGTSSLETVWVSQAGAKQRTGRAGRVQPGHCYRMYTKEKEAEFGPHSTPEILRIPLEQTVLDCKSYAPNESIAGFLSQLPEPPTDKAINLAVNDLKDIGAFSPQEQLTRLGSILSQLCVHPRLGVCLIQGAIVGNILATCYVIAHCSSNTELFVNAQDRREEIREIKRTFSPNSDYWALYCIQEDWREALQSGGRTESDQFCERYKLRGDRLAYIHSLANLHLEQILKSGMIIPTTEPEELNSFSDIEELMSGVLLSGADSLLTTNRYVKTKGKMATVTDIFTSVGERAHIGSESVNHNINKRASSTALLTYFGGHHSTERRALVVYKSSVLQTVTPLLFCPGHVGKENNTQEDDVTILTIPKHRLKIHVPSSQADNLLKAREMLWNTFKYYIERDIKVLEYEENEKVSRFKARLVKIIARILVEGRKETVRRKAFDDNEDLN